MQENLTTQTLQDCPCCKKEIATDIDFCPFCAFPFQETEFKQRMHRRSYYTGQKDLSEAKSKVKYARNTLIIVAIFCLLAGISFFILLSREDTSLIYYSSYKWNILITSIVSAVIYGLLAWWCNKRPFEASLTGLIIYISYIIINAVSEPSKVTSWLLIKILIISLLLGGVRSALKLRKEEKNNS